MSGSDKKYMYRALQLASLGWEWASPNPLVGAVVVYGNRIIGEGYHKRCGEAHAEVNAIASVKEQDRHLLTKSTIYVTLEPCSHYGKTPPCSELIIKTGIPKVVIAMQDPFAKVAGRGINMLRQAAIDVEVGLLEKEALEVNRHFITSVTKQRPYTMLKWAESSDGYIGVTKRPVAITSSTINTLSHRMRARYDAIMVGTQTALCDNCSLTVKNWFGPNPLRVILDRSAKIPHTHNIFDGDVKTIIFTQREGLSHKNVEYIKVDFDDMLLDTILGKLNQMGIRSLMVEGGEKLLSSFISKGVWDEAYQYKSSTPLSRDMDEKPVKAPCISSELIHTESYLNNEKITTYRNL